MGRVRDFEGRAWAVRPDGPPVCDYEGSDYQERFWEQGGREYEDRVEAIALHRLLPTGGKRLLELGAGAGRNTERYRGYAQVVLLDYSRSQIELARRRLGDRPDRVYVVGDLYSLPFGGALFDAATMIRVLHHLVEPAQALAEVRRVLAPQAAFILEYANKRNLKAILRWALGRQEWSPFQRAPVEWIDLNFNFHPASVRELLAEVGLPAERTLTVSHFRVGLLKRILPVGLLVQADALAQLTGGLWQLSPSVFVRARASGAGRVELAEWAWRCPVCGSLELNEEGRGLRCARCGRLWSTANGVYDFKKPVDE